MPPSPPAARGDLALASLYALSLVGFPLVSIAPLLLGAPGRPISIAFRALVLALALYLVARRALAGAARLRGPPLWCFSLLWLLLSIRLVWDATVVPLPVAIEWSDYFAFAFGVSLLPAIAMAELPSRATLQRAAWLTHVLGTLALVGIALLGARMLLSGRLITRLATDTLNPASVGYHAVTVFITAVATRAALSGRRGGWPAAGRALQLAVMLAAIAVTVASGSRGPVIALSLVMGLTAVAPMAGGRSQPRRLLRIAGLAVLVVAVVAASSLVEELSSLAPTSRIAAVAEDESTAERVVMLRAAWEQFASHPWLGDQLVERAYRSYPHNMFLEAGMSLGIAGVVCLLGFSLTALAAALRNYRAGWEYAWLGLLLIVYLVASVISGALIFLSQFWALAIAALVADAARRAGPAGQLITRQQNG